MQSLISKLRSFVAFCAALLCLGGAAQAATFSVDPIAVTLSQGDSSVSIAVTNQSPQQLRLQITGFGWQQNASGEMELPKTDDLLFFPQMLTLDPGETHRIRVGVTQSRGPVEKTFRVFMEEMPSLQSVLNPNGASQVTVRMKIGVPVFLRPAGPVQIGGAVRNATLHGGTLSFDVANTGNVHFSIQSVRVTGTGLSQTLSGWYVLAGGVRHYTVKVPATRCESLEAVRVDVQTDAVRFGQTFSPLVKQCAVARAR